MMEWALRWVSRNVPQDRSRTCLLHGDPGQFLFEEGRVTTLYDFEATHIGDPLHDLAALRLRHPTEPLGAGPHHMVRHYARITGMVIDRSEEHTSELQSLMRTSYAVFCLKNNNALII